MQQIDKNLQLKCGVYIIFNLQNGKRYIGSSINIYNRLHEHYHILNRKEAHNKHFQAAWNKYGEDMFMYGILEYCDKSVQFEREQYYIDLFSPEYNLTNNVIANTGHEVSEETKQKISDTLKEKYSSGEISAYRQDHNWIKCYIYNIRTWKLEAECKCIADAMKLVSDKGTSRSQTYATTTLFKNRYIISLNKFEDLNQLINHVSQNYLIANSKFGKYIIVKKHSGRIQYYRTLISAAQDNSTSKSTLSKQKEASFENPYIIRKSESTFFYSNKYIPIQDFVAVPIEESSELLSGNIGETPEMDNTEINSEIKESESSYSVDSETL